MNPSPSISSKIAAVARSLAVERKDRLDALKAPHADISRPDFLWHYLLQSFATMGGSSGWAGLMGTPANYERVRFDVLAGLAPARRKTQVFRVCRDAKLRWPERKTGFVLAAFEKIRDLGGVPAANKILFEAPGREGKMKFLKSFKGIGPKYARNMMMDVYHEDFRDSIAIDSRIKKLSAAWGLAFGSYDEHERFYLAVASDAGLNGWELDRLLYNFTEEFVGRVGSRSSSSSG